MKTNIAVVMLLPQCNMKCLFCITENSLIAMTRTQAVDLLCWLKEKGFESVVLGGGEPFLWRGDLIGLADTAQKMGLTVQVGTNGTLLPDGFEQLREIDRFVLPIDAATAAANDQIRLYDRSHYAIILDRLEKLRLAKKEVTLSTIVTAQNIAGLKELSDFLKNYARNGGLIHAWHLYQFIPEGRGGKTNQSAFILSEATYNGACTEIKNLRLPFTVFKRRNMYHASSVDFFWRTKEAWHSAKLGKFHLLSPAPRTSPVYCPQQEEYQSRD